MIALSLVMCVRDESDCVEGAIRSVQPFVDEVVVLDTGSADGTPDKCLAMGARVYRLETEWLGFDFGQAKSMVSAMARGEFVLLLDADERLTGGQHLFGLLDLMDDHHWLAVGLPRRRWADPAMTEQVEKAAYPDFQARLYRNNPGMVRWNGALHETLSVRAENLFFPKDDPIHIEHFVDHYHLSDPARKARRLEQRTALARRAGTYVEGSLEAAERAGAMNHFL